MATIVLGWVLTVVGVLFIFLGLVAASRQVRVTTAAAPKPGITGVLHDAAVLLDALRNLPLWLALTVIGIVLVTVGQMLVHGWPSGLSP
jgi:uncharacterized membrane protein